MDIKWTDSHPKTGERRYVRAVKFAGEWQFSYRNQRRDVRWRRLKPTRVMWEFVLDSLKRRYRRREGVSDEDVAKVERVLRAWREPPRPEGNEEDDQLEAAGQEDAFSNQAG
jgi:hypothetical protein